MQLILPAYPGEAVQSIHEWNQHRRASKECQQLSVEWAPADSPVGSNNNTSISHVNCLFTTYLHVGRGGALVESMPFDPRVMGSNPALAAT